MENSPVSQAGDVAGGAPRQLLCDPRDAAGRKVHRYKYSV